MKSNTVKLMTVLVMVLAMTACKKDKNKTEATKAEEVSQISDEAIKYTANVDNSTLAWKGFKPTGTHNGTIKISEGYVALTGGKLTAGNFIIDMNTIADLSVEKAEMKAKLEAHLASGDFFDIENHPYSVFAITGVEEKDGKMMVKGNLTVKNIKKNIEFPATITDNGDMVNFKSEVFTIDRTEWDIKFKSGKFFKDLKDNFINDEIEFTIDVNAKKS